MKPILPALPARAEIMQFVRFVIVGCTAAAIHYGCYYLLQLYIDVNLAYTAGYCIALVCNFFLTTYFTFRRQPSARKAVGFGFSHLINYLLHILLFNTFLFFGVSRELAPLLVLLIAVPTNFLLLHFVFTSKRYDKENS